MSIQLEAITVRPNSYFTNYNEMLSFLDKEKDDVNKVLVYFKRRDKSLEEYQIMNLNQRFNFPASCKIMNKNGESKTYNFDYSSIEDMLIYN